MGVRRTVVATIVLVLVAGPGCSPGRPPRNVILISIDTLRADRLEAYGYGRPTSPAIRELAARGVRFANVIAPANWTLPSHMTLFTGLAPSAHQVTTPWVTLSADVRTLAEILRDHGYRTLGFTGGGLVSRRYGFARGFERYDEPLELPRALGLAGDAIRQMKADEKFFVFIHTFAVHCPYDPPPAYAARFVTTPPEDHIETKGRCGLDFYDKVTLTPGQARFVSDRYDAAIRQADDLLGEFLRELDGRGTLDDTLVVLTSDHGEAFLEHGHLGHHDAQYMELLRVPWIMTGPGCAPRVVEQPAGLADVMPTLLDLLAIPAPRGQGTSLRPQLEGRTSAESARSMFSESDWTLKLRSEVAGEYHLIVGGETPELFHWRADPLERSNLLASEDARAAAMGQELVAYFSGLEHAATELTHGRPAEIDEAQRARLRALGYLE